MAPAADGEATTELTPLAPSSHDTQAGSLAADGLSHSVDTMHYHYAGGFIKGTELSEAARAAAEPEGHHSDQPAAASAAAAAAAAADGSVRKPTGVSFAAADGPEPSVSRAYKSASALSRSRTSRTSRGSRAASTAALDQRAFHSLAVVVRGYARVVVTALAVFVVSLAATTARAAAQFPR